MNQDIGKQILWLTIYLMSGFGVIVTVWSIVAKIRGQEIKTLWTRYLAWFGIIPPIIIPLIYSQEAFKTVILFLSLLCFREYSRVTGLWKDRKFINVSYLAIIAIYFPVFIIDYGFYQAFPIYTIVLVLLIPTLYGEYEHMIQKTCLAVLGVVYFGWFLSHLAYLRNNPNGIAYVFFLMVLVESNDAFAYIWGKLLGRHKLIPKISPNKTVEGAVGGFLSTLLLGYLLRFLLPHISLFHILILSSGIAFFGTCGDLTISFIKRDLKIKDIGNLIPGHGGLLDRFDSLIFTVPLYFHYLRYFYYGQ